MDMIIGAALGITLCFLSYIFINTSSIIKYFIGWIIANLKPKYKSSIEKVKNGYIIRYTIAGQQYAFFSKVDDLIPYSKLEGYTFLASPLTKEGDYIDTDDNPRGQLKDISEYLRKLAGPFSNFYGTCTIRLKDLGYDRLLMTGHGKSLFKVLSTNDPLVDILMHLKSK